MSSFGSHSSLVGAAPGANIWALPSPDIDKTPGITQVSGVLSVAVGANEHQPLGTLSAGADHKRSFRTDIERFTGGHRGWAPLDVVKSIDTQALLRGAIAQSVHTATDASLARYLQDRPVADNDIRADLTVCIGR